MNIAAIQEVIHRQPFRPFALRLADGRELIVPHRDYIAVSPRVVVVINPQNDAASILEPLLIVSIEAAGAPSSNNP